MKPAMSPIWARLSPVMLSRALMISALLALGIGEARAIEVDSEIVILVDNNFPGVTNQDFDTMMEGYAAALSSSQVLDSIASGERGRIAVSMTFYGTTPGETVGIPWMSIGSAADAQAAADAIRSITRPRQGTVSLEDGIRNATANFGSETGNAGNGFESLVQVIEVAATTRPRSPADQLAASIASSDALAAGVDSLSTMTLGRHADTIAAYYESNVVGGTMTGGGEVTVGGDSAAWSAQFSQYLGGQVGSAADMANAAVPEPSVPMMLMFSFGAWALFVRRRA